ncbi:MAG TPA: sugar ABC transporter permease [Acidimicrobiia bacterium]
MSSHVQASTGEAGTAPASPPARGHGSFTRWHRWWGLAFVAPWVIGFLLWYAIPMLASLWFSFTDFNLVSNEPTNFVGLANWGDAFTDPEVRSSAWVTIKFAVIALPVGLGVPLGLAYLLTARTLWARSLFRTLFYLPSIIPFVAAVLIIGGVLNGQTGWLNRFLSTFGISGPDWTNSTFWIYPSLVFIGLWGIGNLMIIYIAGINSVPGDLYDAARVDGATTFQMFRKVTLPLISPVTFYILIISLIGLFQYFLVPFVLKNGSGDPNGQTYFYNLYFYRVAFRLHEMGYASTLAWLLFIVALAVTAALFWSAKYWVHYEFTED